MQHPVPKKLRSQYLLESYWCAHCVHRILVLIHLKGHKTDRRPLNLIPIDCRWVGFGDFLCRNPLMWWQLGAVSWFHVSQLALSDEWLALLFWLDWQFVSYSTMWYPTWQNLSRVTSSRVFAKFLVPLPLYRFATFRFVASRSFAPLLCTRILDQL